MKYPRCVQSQPVQCIMGKVQSGALFGLCYSKIAAQEDMQAMVVSSLPRHAPPSLLFLPVQLSDIRGLCGARLVC